MTVGEMRKLMLEKVVPENVVPQNIIDFLMDENAELPEPDAYTFLTRLRTLGIGSADFLNLMEGCGAPDAAVNRIRSNPAMNLQSLILTLEGSGMTSKDYTRILYTARQIWERTLTMRLESSEKISGGEYPDESAPDEDYAEFDEPDFSDVMEQTISEGGTGGTGSEGSTGYDEDSEDSTGYGEDNGDGGFDDSDDDMVYTPEIGDTSEFSADETGTFEFEYVPDGEDDKDEEFDFTGTFSKVPEKRAPSDETMMLEKAVVHDGRAGNAETVSDKADSADNGEYEFHSEEDISENAKTAKKNFKVNIDYGDEYPEEQTEAVPTEKTGYNGETTMIIPIDRDALERGLSDLSAGADSDSDSDESRETYETPSSTDFPEESEESAEQAPEPEQENAVYDGNGEYGENEDEDYDDDPRERKRPNKGALIAASVGGAVVLGAGAAAGYFFGFGGEKIEFAESSEEIYREIYRGYENDFPFGAEIPEYTANENKVFGDGLLIHTDGFGTFSLGSDIYSVSGDGISAGKFDGSEITFSEDITPPDGAVIVAAFEDGDSLVTVFSGRQSGFMRIENGTEVFTVLQDGRLTDYRTENGEISLGTVYSVSGSIRLDSPESYLPRVGKDTADAIPFENVILSRTDGCAYGVSGSYSLENGSTVEVCAALGKPVGVGANGSFAFSGSEDKDLLVKKDGEDIITEKCGKITAAAFLPDGCAVCENGEVIIRGEDLKAVSRAAALTDAPKSLRFDGNCLAVSGEDGIFLMIDCTDPANASSLSLTKANGFVRGDRALVYGTDDKSAFVTAFVLENGKASESGAFSVALSAEELETFGFGGTNTMLLTDKLGGIAYSYYDGVSVVSAYVSVGNPNKVTTHFDDRTGYTLAFTSGGSIFAVNSEGAENVSDDT